MTFEDRAFERHARDAHRAALRSLSPRVRAQLQRRTRLALAGEAPARARDRAATPRWGWIAAPAMALAFAFALPWPGADDPGTAPAATVAAPPASAAELAAPLEHDPDFYLWLATADAVALASDRP